MNIYKMMFYPSRCSNFVPPQNIPQLSGSLSTEAMPEVSLEVVQETGSEGHEGASVLNRNALPASQRDPATTGLCLRSLPLSNEPATAANTGFRTEVTENDTPTPRPGSLPSPPSSGPTIELPQFTPMANPIFTWGSHSSESFIHSLNATYAEVVHWKINSFKVPQGSVGKSFVSELARLFNSFASGSALESIALQAATVLPILLLQKPSRKSKTKDHILCLQRRLKTWKDGDLNELTNEGRTIQHRIPKASPSEDHTHLARSFARLMFQGKTKAALRLLTGQGKGGVLHVDDTERLSVWPPSPSHNHMPHMLPSLMDKLASGPTLLALPPASVTCSNHSKILSEQSFYLQLLGDHLQMIQNVTCWHCQPDWEASPLSTPPSSPTSNTQLQSRSLNH